MTNRLEDGAMKTIVVCGSAGFGLHLVLKYGVLTIESSLMSAELTLLISCLISVVIGYILFYLLSVRSTSSLSSSPSLHLKNVLSSQELRVLSLIADGMSNREIGHTLFIAETTVKTHCTNIFSKLNVRRRTEAVKIGRQMGIIGDSSFMNTFQT